MEAVISKLDTILQSVLRNKKTNDQSQAKVYEMEQTLKEFLTVTRFREDVQRIETRLTQSLDQKMDKVRVKISELSTQISEAASQNKEKI